MPWGQTRKTRKLLAEGKGNSASGSGAGVHGAKFDTKTIKATITYVPAPGMGKVSIRTSGTKEDIQKEVNMIRKGGGDHVIVKTTGGTRYDFRTG